MLMTQNNSQHKWMAGCTHSLPKLAMWSHQGAGLHACGDHMLRDSQAAYAQVIGAGEGGAEHTLPPRCSRTRASKDSKMSMEGWWMVTMTVRPLRDTFLMLCMTIAAARASSPAAVESQDQPHGQGCPALGKEVFTRPAGDAELAKRKPV